MANTGFENFDRTVQQTNEILSQIEEKYGWQERRNQSYAAMSAVLQALRDRLPVNQAVHLGAQLPMLLRGVYYEGWEPNSVPHKMNKEEFLQKIRENFVFSLEEDIEELAKTVLEIIFDQVSKGEAEKVKDVLPEDFADLIN